MRGIPILAVAALTACGSRGASDGGGQDGNAIPPGSCFTGDVGVAMPLVHVGPDVSVNVACQTSIKVPIASISSLSGPGFTWRVSKAGDDAVGLSIFGGIVCTGAGPTIVNA